MTLVETVSQILNKDVSLDEAKDFANNQFGVLSSFLRKRFETRVYIIDKGIKGIDYDENPVLWSDEDFIEVAETDGNVYSLEGFKRTFNDNDFDSKYYIIRFIEVEINL